MMRRILFVATMAVLLIGLRATPLHAESHDDHGHGAHAEHGDDHAEHGDDHGGHGEHPIGLSPDAINWADFGYAETAEEYYNEHHVKVGPPVVALVINFLLLLTIIYFVARKPVGAMLQQRSDKVREDLREAQRMLEEANEQLADYSAKLERMDDEMTRLREEFIAAGVAERDRLVADAGAKAEKLRKDAEVRLQQEMRQMREELRLELIDQAVGAATETLRKQIKEPDQKRMADDYVTRIEQEGTGR